MQNIEEIFLTAFALHQQGEVEQAKALYETILQSEPHHFDALHMLGVAITNEDPARAVDLLSQALALNSGVAECFNNAANAILKMGQYPLALECAHHAIALNAGHWQAFANGAEALRNMQRQTEAMEWINQALELAPDNANLYSNRGNLNEELCEYEKALLDIGTAIELDPNDARFYVNRGIVYQSLNLIYPAIADQEKAIALNPELAVAHMRLARLLLLKGDYLAGWGQYDWRWKQTILSTQPLLSSKPTWLSDDAKASSLRVLVWAEQGLDDQIFFGGLLPEMQALAPHVLVQMDQRLIPLFARSMPEITFYPTGTPIDESLYDAHIPMGDLGRLFRNQMDDFLNIKTHYLTSDLQTTKAIQEKITSPEELLIGIAWKGQNRSAGVQNVLDLSQLIAAFNFPGVRFVSLQEGDVDAEIAGVHQEHMIGVMPYQQVGQDLDTLASVISSCDLVISVDNATAHLAGALHVPCWLILPKAPNWHWLSGVYLSPWYPSLRLYRQQAVGQWGSVLQDIREDIIPLLKAPAQYN